MKRSTRNVSLAIGTLSVVLLLIGACSPEGPLQSDEPAEPEIVEEASSSVSADEAQDSYHNEIEGWQRQRAERLQAEGGWLSLVGLYWLEDGPNTFGTGPENAMVLPEGSAPAVLGTINLERVKGEGGEPKVVLQLEPAEGAEMFVKDKPLRSTIELVTDLGGNPTEFRHGTLTFFAIERTGRYGLRVRDSAAAALVDFAGLDYFPIDPKWRIEGRFEPYVPPKMIPIANIVGIESEEPSPGAIAFEVRGRTYRLDALDGGEGELFVIFADGTTGKETYGAGRYLYTERPRSGAKVVIDFNRAYNPPCAFTAFATCPLPPRQNKLKFRIDAGEKNYVGHEDGNSGLASPG